MPPNPFPFPFGVGIDTCRVERILNIMKEEARFNHWARKIFTRLEWPWIYKRVHMASTHELEQAPSEQTCETKLFLPSVSEQIPSDIDAQQGPSFVVSPINSLAQFLAGRSGAQLASPVWQSENC